MVAMMKFNMNEQDIISIKPSEGFNILVGLSKWLSDSRVNLCTVSSDEVLKDEEFNFLNNIWNFLHITTFSAIHLPLKNSNSSLP